MARDVAEIKYVVYFEPVRVELQTVQSAALLLSTTEIPLLLKVLRLLNAYCGKSMEHRLSVLEVNIIKVLYPLVNSSELSVKRYSLRLYALMCELDEFTTEVLSDDSNVKNFVTMLKESEDKYMQEFSSLILAKLTNKPEGIRQINQLPILELLFVHLKSPDPDIQKNCLEILGNLLAEALHETSSFQWTPILNCLTSPYIQIQSAALNIIKQLLTNRKNSSLQDDFREANGLHKLFDVLDVHEWKDVHATVLDILNIYLQTRNNISYFCNSGSLQRLLSFLREASEGLQSSCINLLIAMSTSEGGKNVSEEKFCPTHSLEIIGEQKICSRPLLLCPGDLCFCKIRRDQQNTMG